MLHFTKIKEITNKSKQIKMMAYYEMGKPEYLVINLLHDAKLQTPTCALTTVATLLPSNHSNPHRPHTNPSHLLLLKV